MTTTSDGGITRDALLETAGAVAFKRGEDCLAEGHVAELEALDGRVMATVRGHLDYRVRLEAQGRALIADCTCPASERGAFCKHAVAAGLAWLEQRASGQGIAKAPAPAVTLQDVRAHLSRLDKEALVELFLEQALTDESLLERLRLEAVRQRGAGSRAAALREALDRAVTVRGFVPYAGTASFAAGIEAVAEEMKVFLRDGHGKEVVALSEHALAAVERAMESVDDSDGALGGVLHMLQAVHVEACRAAPPHPEALARRLFERALWEPYGVFPGVVAYAEALGGRGKARFRELAEARWAAVPVLGPGDSAARHDDDRPAITRVMAELARESGDLEALVAVLRRDLSMPYCFQRIAEVYREAGREDQAIAWAERGLSEFPQHADRRLRDVLAQLYRSRGQYDKALEQAWARFEERPALEQFRSLKEYAEAARQWPAQRERALAHIRAGIRQDRKDRSILVRIFLWEGNCEAAWAEAQAGGCDRELWLKLAEWRAVEQVEEALQVYQRLLGPVLAHASYGAYQEAVALLKRIDACQQRLGRTAEFGAQLAELRRVHKRRRNFVRLLDAAFGGRT